MNIFAFRSEDNQKLRKDKWKSFILTNLEIVRCYIFFSCTLCRLFVLYSNPFCLSVSHPFYIPPSSFSLLFHSCNLSFSFSIYPSSLSLLSLPFLPPSFVRNQSVYQFLNQIHLYLFITLLQTKSYLLR